MVTPRAKSCFRRGQKANQPPLPWGKSQPARALWPGATPVAANYCPGAGCTTHGGPRPQTSALQDRVQGLPAWRHLGGGACLRTPGTPSSRAAPPKPSSGSGGNPRKELATLLTATTVGTTVTSPPPPPLPQFCGPYKDLWGKVSRCSKWLGGELSKGVTWVGLLGLHP